MPDTRIIKITDINKDSELLDEVAAILAAGGTVAIPTETVYGLAANAYDEAAVEKIFEAKGRPQDNPLIVHICEFGQLADIAAELPPEALKLARHFWPGPLTVVLKKTDRIPDAVSAGLPTVAVRFPKNLIARELIRRSGVPLAAPSANRSGGPSPTTAKHCIDDLMGRVDAIVDGGDCGIGLESTVVSLAEQTPRLLRPGFVTLEQLTGVLGEVYVDKAVYSELAQDEPASSPGLKHKHYAPRCEVILADTDAAGFARFLEDRQADGVFALCFDEDIPHLTCRHVSIGPQGDLAAQAANLFSALRQLDELGAKVVYARLPESAGVGLAVYNRLLRAAGFKVIKL